MKDSTYKNLVGFVSGIGWVVSLMLTIYICTKIYSTANLFWIIVSFGTGIILNTGELLLLIHYLKTGNLYSFILMVVLGCLSISASVGALQTGFKRGEKITQIQDEVLKQMQLQDDLIKNYKENSTEARNQAQSKRNLSNMYLNKSNSFLKQAEKLLSDRKNDLEYISSTFENTLALSLYESYSKLFGGSVERWALIFNIIFGVSAEVVMLFFNALYYDLNRKSSPVKSSVTQPKSSPKIVTSGVSDGQSSPRKLRNVPPLSSVTPQPVTVVSDGSDDRHQIGFRVGDDSDDSSPGAIHESPNQPMTVSSSEAILNLYDSGEQNKAAIARQVGCSSTWVKTTLKKYRGV